MVTYELKIRRRVLTLKSPVILSISQVAQEFVKHALSTGPEEVSEIMYWAKKIGIPHTTIHRAANELDVYKDQRGFGENRSSVWFRERPKLP